MAVTGFRRLGGAKADLAGPSIAVVKAMKTWLTALLAAGSMLVVANGVAAQGSERVQTPGPSLARHSGTVVSVDAAARTLVVQELVEEGRPRHLTVRLPEGAPVVLSERIPDEQMTRLDAAFVERPIDLAEVRPGDFVVVQGAARGALATVSAVVVTLRAGRHDGSPAASPGARR